MKMIQIEKFSKIKKENLNSAFYFQSLLEESYQTQTLGEAEIEKIQLDCLGLLAKKTGKYNSGDSSSIPIEKAQDILKSLMFTIGIQLKTYESPEVAIDNIRKYGVEEICEEGSKRMNELLKQTQILHISLLSHLIQTKNVFYKATISEGIKGFFKLYYLDFSAHEIHITADYPVYNKRERLLGIEFIRQYLDQLYYENLFCSYFTTEDIHHLFCGYNEDYENLLFNLYKPILGVSLGCVLAGIDEGPLELTPTAQDYLCYQFTGKDKKKIEELLAGALFELSQKFSFSNKLLKYIKESLPQLATEIESAAKVGKLNQIFILPEYPESSPKLIAFYGEKIDDKRYRKILEEFRSDESIAEKIKLIRREHCSLADINDLLLDSQLKIEGMMAFLKMLDPSEITALMKKYNLAYEMGFTDFRDCEKILCEGLQRFLHSLPIEEQVTLNKAMKLLKVN